MWVCVALRPTGRNKRTSRCELGFVYPERIEGGRQRIEGGDEGWEIERSKGGY